MQGASIFGFTHSSHLNFSSKQWKIKQATNNPKQCPFHSICLTSSPLENHCGSTKSTVSRRLGGEFYRLLQIDSNIFLPGIYVLMISTFTTYCEAIGLFRNQNTGHTPRCLSWSNLWANKKRIKPGKRMFALIKLISSMQKSTSRWLWLGAVKHHSPVEKQI